MSFKPIYRNPSPVCSMCGDNVPTKWTEPVLDDIMCWKCSKKVRETRMRILEIEEK